jgi:zinc/manganese transport system ATP-binding protein
VIEDWHTEGRTVIAVLHDMTVVRRHFPHTLLLGGLSAQWDLPWDSPRDAQLGPGLQAA